MQALAPSDLRAVTFDAGGTLFHLAESPGATYARFGARHGLTLESEQANAAFKIAWKTMPRPAFTHPNPRPDDDAGWWRRIVMSVCESCGLQEHPKFEAFFEELYDHYGTAQSWKLDADARNVLEAARASGMRVGLLSNYDKRLRRLVADHQLEATFDFITISSEVGADKPHAAIFAAAAIAAGTEPSRILHVGDDEECDEVGASAAGFHTWRLTKDRPLSTVQEGMSR